LLTDEDPALRERLIQVLFQDGKFQWERLVNLIQLAREGTGGSKSSSTSPATTSAASSNGNGSSSRLGVTGVSGVASSSGRAGSAGGLDLSDTVRDALRLLLVDEKLRRQVILALTEDNRLHVAEVRQVLALLEGDVNPQRLVGQVISDLPSLSRQLMLGWADKVLVS
jgi:hypothetical protein